MKLPPPYQSDQVLPLSAEPAHEDRLVRLLIEKSAGKVQPKQ
jgi:hypothetical protein